MPSHTPRNTIIDRTTLGCLVVDPNPGRSNNRDDRTRATTHGNSTNEPLSVAWPTITMAIDPHSRTIVGCRIS